MAYSVTFKLKDVVLAHYEFEATTPDKYEELVETAFESFRKAHPNILLFDGVTVIYDKS